jgi:hypothetical protein
MHEFMHDPIEVTVSFCGARVKPTSITWNNRHYSIPHVNLVHNTLEGQNRIFYFSVSDATNFMKLRFDTSTLSWHIIELYAE